MCVVRPSATAARALPPTMAAAAAQSIFNNKSNNLASAAACAIRPKATTKRNVLPLEFVNSASVKSALPVIGNGAYALLASGFIMTDMLTLRVALVGGYAGLVAFHALHARPLRIPLRWSGLFIALNAGAAAFLIADQWCSQLSKEEEELYEDHFSMLTRGQFHQLLSLASPSRRERSLPDGTRLTTEGVACGRLYFIVSGSCKVYLSGAYAKTLEEGSFVNDVAFQQGDGAGAYGTVMTSGEVKVMEWELQELREHLESRPDMDRNMRYCLSTHLVKGLMQQRKSAHMTIRRWTKDRLDDSGGLGLMSQAQLLATSSDRI